MLLALMAFSRDAGDLRSGLDYAEQLARITPEDRNIAGFVEELRRQIKNPRAE